METQYLDEFRRLQNYADRYGTQLTEMPEEDLEEWTAGRIESYGDDWPKVETLLAELRTRKIYLGDVKPGNITVLKG